MGLRCLQPYKNNSVSSSCPALGRLTCSSLTASSVRIPTKPDKFGRPFWALASPEDRERSAMITLDVLIRIVANGGGVIIDASRFTRDALIQIAANAAGKGSHVIIRKTGVIMADDLVRIAAT